MRQTALVMFFYAAISSLVLAADESATCKIPESASKESGSDGHALAFFGEPEYPASFTHFNYTDPAAPKVGAVTLWGYGSYDTVNPYTVRGVPADELGLTTANLAVQAADEKFTVYGNIAERFVLARDRSWMRVTLRGEARFHDGTPITGDDVVFTLETLKNPTKAHPTHALLFRDIVCAVSNGQEALFVFKTTKNRELPLITATMPVLSRAYWQDRDFSVPTLESQLGSEPYKISDIDPGRSITYERVKDWWGENLPVNRGRYNFQKVRIKYYKDHAVSLEALKAGEYDFRKEYVSKQWMTAYTGPSITAGWLKKELFPDNTPKGMQGFVYNTRRAQFADPRVREALTLAFDFEWVNSNLMLGAYKRAESYFTKSESASRGVPAGEELAILQKYRAVLPPQVFGEAYRAPKTDGSGRNRDNLRAAGELLKEAGWCVDRATKRLVKAYRNGACVPKGDETPFAFEFLARQDGFDRLVNPWIQNLAKLGIAVTFRLVDVGQYGERERRFDFDVIITTWGQSFVPGNEQHDCWGSVSSAREGSSNYAGIKDPVVDALIDLLIAAGSWDELSARGRALDRVLLSGHYAMPNWYIESHRIAYWDKFGRPEREPKYSLGFFEWTWWIDNAKLQKIVEAQKSAPQKKK